MKIKIEVIIYNEYVQEGSFFVELNESIRSKIDVEKRINEELAKYLNIPAEITDYKTFDLEFYMLSENTELAPLNYRFLFTLLQSDVTHNDLVCFLQTYDFNFEYAYKTLFQHKLYSYMDFAKPFLHKLNIDEETFFKLLPCIDFDRFVTDMCELDNVIVLENKVIVLSEKIK